MTEKIIPLRQRGDSQSSLARFDLVAAELLAAGQATSLQAARIEAILADLRAKRDQLTMLLLDLRGREPTGYAELDATNTNLITAINQGIVQIDMFIARARVLASDPAQSGLAQSGASVQAPTYV